VAREGEPTDAYGTFVGKSLDKRPLKKLRDARIVLTKREAVTVEGGWKRLRIMATDGLTILRLLLLVLYPLFKIL
jgi:hypothetical protein